MSGAAFLSIRNGDILRLKDVPHLAPAEFRDHILRGVDSGWRIVSLFGKPIADRYVRLYAVMANDRQGSLSLCSADVTDQYPALTGECPQAHWFEREIAEQWGVIPKGHPWLKPVRFHEVYRFGTDAWGRDPSKKILPGVTDFFQVRGEEVHEVAVGPVHAGVIEPGHFRFQCHGEKVFHLEISLGYQHRGVERSLIGAPAKRVFHYMETLAGDTTIGHATAYAQAMETLARCKVPARAQALRGVMLELERLANHAGDLGALAGDVAYLPTASYCGRIRGDFLNLSALICGSRFGRGMILPGGVRFDLDEKNIAELLSRLNGIYKNLCGAVNLLWDSPSVMNRFEGTGTLSAEACENLGLVGIPARACGLERDIRFDFPAGIYRLAQLPVSTYTSGDVFARAYVRWLEVQRSVDFLQNQLATMPEGPVSETLAHPASETLTVSLVEGWRGEICHVAMTDKHGHIAHYKVVDPSFHNWMGLAMALRGEPISDFPLCNKSFNLSYCGHDL
ncbi:MAG: NADH-quinone oxidoreductase subunit C [Candidatus Omnitrophica bacterium]|nr:NADH-quinone oxidoreductase subunit C [Candidatus Omnitrophota bacterium]MDD5671092.1 NADH-quinone oxidoreductase subunit C [Candidatus Omnitrophota bacterium]